MKFHKIGSFCVIATVAFALAFWLLPTQTYAATDGYFTYTVTNSQATLADCDTAVSGAIMVPSSLGGYPVTAIGNKAFADCTGLTGVTIPDSVTSIGYYAFDGCTALTSVSMPDSITSIGYCAFFECTALTSIGIPKGISAIPDTIFYRCTSLASVMIPDSVTLIDIDAFYGCTALKDVYYAGTTTQQAAITIKDASGSLSAASWHYVTAGGSCGDDLTWALYDDGTIVIAGTGEMEEYTDRNATPWYKGYGTQIKTLVVMPGVTSISYASFEYCKNLTCVILSDTVTSIASQAFNRCTSLLDITIPNSVTSIGSYAFFECTSLTKLAIPGSVVSIGSQAFAMCTGLTEIMVDENNVVYCSDEEGVVFNKSGATLVCMPGAFTGSYTIPKGVTVVEEGAFCYTGLTAVVIPDSVSKISYMAFFDCAGLTDVYYCGTEAQKAAITVGSLNDPLTAAAWHYNVVPELKFSGASVVVHNNLSINFKVDSTLVADAGYVSPYVVFDFGGVETTVTNFTEQDGKYVFTFRNIAPNQIGQTVSATLYATLDDQLCQSLPAVYSVTDYCYRMLDTYAPDNDPNNQYGELRTLLVDLLHYGAASQTYNGDAGMLVNAQLTAEQLAWGSSGELTLTSVLNREHEKAENPTVAWKGAGLALQDCVVVRVKFAAENTEGLKIKATVGDVTYTISETKFVATDIEGVYYIYFDKLSALQLREAIYFTVYSEGEAVSDTLCYSVESYAQKYHTSDNAALAELIKAVIRYGDAAYAYKN